MSAAEMLEALEATIPGDYSNWAAKSGAYETAPNGTHDALVALRNALPQIIAVVEAAERREDFAAPGVARLVADLDEALTVGGKE